MLMQSSSLKESLERATAEHQQHVSLAREYLELRGIKKETSDMFRLGVVLGDGPLDEQYKGRLSIPYIAANGAVVALRYRSLDDSQPKYLSLSDGDEAGKDFGKKMVAAVGAVSIELPSGEDTNSFFVKHGAEQLRSIIRAA